MLRNFSVSASIPWLRLWCGLICSFCLFSAYLYLTVDGLVGFSCGPPSLVVPVCVGFLSEEAELCLLSLLLLGVGLALVGLFWSGFYASSWGTCGFPQRVLQLVTLSGFRNFLAPVS